VGPVHALLLAAAVVLLAGPTLASYASGNADRLGQARRLWQPAAEQQVVLCPGARVAPVATHHRGRHSRRHAVKVAAAAHAQPKPVRAGMPVLASYAVQLKAGLTGAQRQAALQTLRDKYKLKVVKINRGLDILRLAPRAPAVAAKPPKSLGAALTPKIIQDLRQEPFVDAAYVDFPVSPRAKPGRGK